MKLQMRPGFKQMSVPEAKQGKPVRGNSCFLLTTLSQCTLLVIEDPCRVVPAVSWDGVTCMPPRVPPTQGGIRSGMCRVRVMHTMGP